MRQMGKVTFVLAIALAGCAMYPTKSQRMKDPEPIKPSKTLPGGDTVVAAPPPVTDIEECNYRWTPDPAPPVSKKRSARAVQNEQLGDSKVTTFDRSTDANVKREHLLDTIDAYSRALLEEPFNAELTLKLAVAYDKAHRKGCALALLRRLDKMSLHPTYKAAANVIIDEIVAKKELFRRYRGDATRAVGRTGP